MGLTLLQRIKYKFSSQYKDDIKDADAFLEAAANDTTEWCDVCAKPFKSAHGVAIHKAR